MPNINKNIIIQAGAAVANATNKAAGLAAATPEPGTIISAIQLVNGGRTIGPDAIAHFTESVRNKLLSLLVSMEPIQTGAGDPSPDNVRPISGRTGLNVYVSPTSNIADATTYAVDWTSEAGTVYSGTLDVVTGVLTVTWAYTTLNDLNIQYYSSNSNRTVFRADISGDNIKWVTSGSENIHCISSAFKAANYDDNWVPGMVAPLSTGYKIIGFVVAPGFSHDVTDFKTAYGDVQLLYELATPITYQLTAQDVVTLVGDNYIWSDSGDVTITE